MTQANATRGTLRNTDIANPEQAQRSMAARLYAKGSGNTQVPPTIVKLNKPVPVDTSKPNDSDPWRGASQSPPDVHSPVRGGVLPKTAKEAPGNQGARNAHTKPGAIKPVGTPAQMRQASSVTSTAPLQKVGGPNLGPKKGASNAHELRMKAMYPSSRTDSSKKL